jgi:hypothetical protein
MAAELYRLLPRQKPPAPPAGACNAAGGTGQRPPPLPASCNASPRLSNASPPVAYERVLIDVWPPTLPRSPAGVAILNGCVIWQLEDEDAAAFNHRAARIAAICGDCDDAVVYRRVW